MDREEMIARIQKWEDPLELSIEAWEDKQKRLPNNFVEMSSGTCALCYIRGISCTFCIICEYTGESGCRGTPYRDCVLEPTKYNAGRMIAFLKSLRED